MIIFTSAMKVDKSAWLLLFILLMVFIGHLPFLQADPDQEISFSRGPFTDEGLNTIQLRNFLNHGYIDIDECDNLLKTPLFNLVLAAPMAIFGTRLEVGRLTVALLVIASLMIYLRSKRLRPMIIIFALMVLLQYHIFQFTHFVLAEMLAVASAILAIYFYYYARLVFADHRKRRRYLILAASLLACTFLLKIQFIYLLLLMPAAFIIDILLFRKMDKRTGWFLMTGTGVSFIFLMLFIFLWYLPFRDTFEHIMAYQSGSFELSVKSLEYIKFNLTHWLLKGPALLITGTYIISLILLVFRIGKDHTPVFRVLLPVVLAWSGLEMHKLVMVYLPTRYMVSLLASMGLTSALVLSEYWSVYGNRKILGVIRFKWLLAMFISLIFIVNLWDYHKIYTNRSFTIKQVNQYIAQNYSGTGPVIGAWAPSLTWNAAARSFPVWNQFLNYRDPIRTFQPEIIVSEPDEEDSNQAYESQGIDLDAASDSIRCYRIGQWDVSIYWIKSLEKYNDR